MGKCNECDPCQENNVDCSCPVKISTDCVTYTGDTLSCSGIEKDTILTNLIQDLDAHICALSLSVATLPNLVNIGGGSEVYRGILGSGARELRTIISEDLKLVDIIQNSETIGVRPGTHRLEVSGENLSLIVNSLQGDTILSTIPFDSLDNFLVDVNYNHNVSGNNGPFTLDFVMQSGATFDTSLELLNNHLESVVYNSLTSSIDYTITDSTVFSLPIGAIFTDNQVQSNVLEQDNNSPAYINNKNASKTISANYTVVVADNNYIIEINNGANNITINLAQSLGTDDFFVGFIQKGTGTITFIGYDIKPQDLTDVLYGQGHIASMTIINSTKYLNGTFRAI